MKVIFVDNPHDKNSRERRAAALAKLTTLDKAKEIAKRVGAGETPTKAELDPFEGEIHVVDYMLLKDIIPLRAVPCVLILHDELEDVFTAEDIEIAVKGAKEGVAAARSARAAQAPGLNK